MAEKFLKRSHYSMKTPRKLYFKKASDVPNSPLPALLFRGILAPNAAAKARLSGTHSSGTAGQVFWTDTIYDYTHFHFQCARSIRHRRRPSICQARRQERSSIPTQSRRHARASCCIGQCHVGGGEGLKVIGGYPPGQSHFNRKRKGHAVPKIPVPGMDPFYGEGGPVVRFWSIATDLRSNRGT